MSNSLAIAAVTATLQNLLFLGLRDELGSGNITTLPPDKARSNQDNQQVNLFLYHAQPNPAWLNRPKMTQVKQGMTDEPPLGLDLFYLISAYGKNDDEIAGHQLLGRIMSLLHDHKILTPTEIAAATQNSLPESNLHEQLDGLSISPQSLSFEDISKIWQALQAQYRTSAAYQVSVVVLDSSIPVKVALPVLPQTNENTPNGSRTFSSIGVPALNKIQLPHGQRSAQFGDILTLQGSFLNNPHLSVRLLHPVLEDSLLLSPLDQPTEEELQVQLPTPDETPEIASQWVAGFYTLSVVTPQAEYVRTSEEFPLAIAPQILSISPQAATVGNLTIEITCLPQVRPTQRVVLLLGDRGIPVQNISTPDSPTDPSTLTFRVSNVPPGDYVVRLRVDGVDSIPVDFATSPSEFADNQIIRVRENAG
ncbi:DUF4255 domain-containing protein [Spirulina sp. CS-785/01]|uniref:DUF4255 domain-containing protein n=1 Tax=Spirulina sp. CS-785/01 TaxID=3021716 RepID=UPI00232C57AC|nr:DUF4255 domain-containing protein [Spirulina sp. CS-785/01]MDB9313554.1 DUF4255 domain-containing protein [Spirulina sp. CS-785/01]